MTFKVDTVEIVGKEGTTFTPKVVNNVLSWTNNGGLKNPPSVYIKGEQGIQGERGETGKPTESIKDNIVSLETTFSSEKIVNVIDEKVIDSLSNAFNNVTEVKGEKVLIDSVIENSKNGILKNLLIKGVTKKINGKLVSVGNGNKIEFSTIRSDGNFVPNKYEIGGVNAINGSDYINSKYIRSKYFILDKGKYFIKELDETTKFMYLYNLDGSYNDKMQISKKEFIVLDKKYKVRIDISLGRETTLSDFNYSKIIISMNENPINLHKTDIKTIYYKDSNTWKSVLNLNGIDENICDIIDGTKNLLTLSVADGSFTGVEDWKLDISNQNYCAFYFLTKDYQNVIANDFDVVSYEEYTSLTKECITITPSSFNVCVLKSKADTIEKFKNYIKTNNIKFKYQMKEPKQYQVSPTNLIAYEGNTLFSSNSEVSPLAEGYYTHNLNDLVINYLNRISNIENELYK